MIAVDQRRPRVRIRPHALHLHQNHVRRRPHQLSVMASDSKISVLFVCLGNICRSTMAEGVFRSLVKAPQYASKIDIVNSCGTGAYHTGDDPDDRTMSTLKSHGITDYRHSARKVQSKDFSTFDYIFAMDRSNLRDLKDLQERHGGKARVMLFGEFRGGEGKVAEVVGDPYYGGIEGFETAYEQCLRFSKNFLKEVVDGGGK